MSRVIFGSANHWTSPYQVGSHAWARLFAKHGWEVAYISDPITPWHQLFGKNIERNRERFDLWRSGGKRFADDGVLAWVPLAMMAPHRSRISAHPWILNTWDRMSVPSIARRISKWGFAQPDLLWLDSARHAGWGTRLKPGLTVLRVADWSAGFSGVPRAVIELERHLIDTSDLVITASSSLEERIREMRGGRPLHTIRNGVDCRFWQMPCAEPPEYAAIPAPRAVYVGALDEWFDSQLLLTLAKSFPQVSFVLIGNRSAGFAQELAESNIHWMGSQSRGRVRSFLRHSQVGIIPFKRTELVEHVCPLKLYEFMACGLPVVSTRWRELENMGSPARLARNHEEWTDHLQQVLVESQASVNPLPSVGAGLDTNADPLRAYALANDWAGRWEEWMNIQRKLTR